MSLLGEQWLTVNKNKIDYELCSRWTHPEDPTRGFAEAIQQKRIDEGAIPVGESQRGGKRTRRHIEVQSQGP